ncbi:MAG: carboxypeptidase-like regulatory domain-containing protein [Bacteroidota bacterium]|nr:carboxypeptidase-like regulatory domain-containing protein [Bacteroidota bacterium]
MKVFQLLIVLMFITTAQSQTIEGIVLDKNTHEALISANVYFNGTYNGTTTDTLGYFKLNNADHSQNTLVVSLMGYYSESLINYPTDRPVKVFLSPKTFDINEVVVIYNKAEAERARKEGIKLFKKEFLGNTYNARKCKILNLKDIKFVFSEDQKTFEAFAKKPILIYNAALGYSITYHLDSFMKTETSLFYQGNHFFTEDSVITKRQSKKIQRRRRTTYLGSRMHFLRSLYAENTDQEGFIIRDSINNTLPYDSIISGIEGQVRYLITNGETSYIFYPNMKNLLNYKISFITIKTDSVLFSQEGYFDPTNIEWWGMAAKERVGDLLPFEYIVE